MKRRNLHKATNIAVTLDFLKQRSDRAVASGYEKQKWVTFCETLIARGFHLSIYEARKTVSKYITVSKSGRHFKVRFSNHKPIKGRELSGDCDFFVGWTHTGKRTTEDALVAVDEFFAKEAAA